MCIEACQEVVDHMFSLLQKEIIQEECANWRKCSRYSGMARDEPLQIVGPLHPCLPAPVLHSEGSSSCIYWQDKGPRSEVSPSSHMMRGHWMRPSSQGPRLEAAKVAARSLSSMVLQSPVSLGLKGPIHDQLRNTSLPIHDQVNQHHTRSIMLHNTQCCATWLIVYGPL
jgi:hypothetical protein